MLMLLTEPIGWANGNDECTLDRPLLCNTQIPWGWELGCLKM